MKWYMRLASRFISAIELKMMTAPCRRSALWKDVRFEGIDFVRRCRNAPWWGRECAAWDRGPFSLLLLSLPFSGRRAAPSVPGVAVDPLVLSRTRLRLRDSSLAEPLSPAVDREGARPRRPRCHSRPTPSQTKPVIHLTSLLTTWPHHRTSTPKARQKRIGRMVKVHSQASRHAKAPKFMVLSRKDGSSRKFFNRSNLTALDSLGRSDVYE